MFGSLKKKLKEAIDKISGKIEKEDHVVLEEKDFKAEEPEKESKNEGIVEEHEAPEVLIETEEEWKKQHETDKKIINEIDDEIQKLDNIEKELQNEIKEKDEEKVLVKEDKILIEEIEEQKKMLEKVKEETINEELPEEEVEEIKDHKVIQEIAETLEEKMEVESRQEEKEEKILGKEDQPLIEKALEDLENEDNEKELAESAIEEIKLADILKAEEEHKKTIEEKTIQLMQESELEEHERKKTEQHKKIRYEEKLPEIEIEITKEELKKIKEEKIVEPEVIIEDKKEEKFSLFKKISEKTLSEEEITEVLENIKTVLLENDVALEVTERICGDINHSLRGKTIKRGKTTEVIESALRDAIFDVLNQEKIDLEDLIKNSKEPLLVMVLGFNGVGKTTTVARLAQKYKKYNPVIAAGDTFRAASIEQLEEHGKNLKVDIVKHRYGADSAAVIFDAKKHAQAKGSKLVLGDTAGRAHTNTNLMDELKKVCRVNKPDLKILVLDALTGNDIYEQARLFDQAVGVDAIILTKTDVYEKGGAALSAAYTIKKPILFLGSGQGYGDLKEFNPEDIVKNLLG